MNCSPPGSSVHGILQAGILKWVAISFSRRSSQLRDLTWVSSIAGRFLSTELPGKSLCSFFNSWNLTCEVAQSYPTLCDPMDCSLPGSSIHGIFQARILEWVAISFSRRSFQPRDWTHVSRIVGRRFTIWPTSEVSRGEDNSPQWIFGNVWRHF